jgi:hypothetical protein
MINNIQPQNRAPFICFVLLLGPVSPTAVKVNCRLKCFVTVVTYCFNNVFVYFNQQLTLTGGGESSPYNSNFILLLDDHKIMKPMLFESFFDLV